MLKLAVVTWNITSLVGKEPEHVQDVARYQLDIVGLTSMQATGSGTDPSERGRSRFYAGVVQGDAL